MAVEVRMSRLIDLYAFTYALVDELGEWAFRHQCCIGLERENLFVKHYRNID